MDDKTAQTMNTMAETASEQSGLVLPPPVFTTMGGEILDVDLEARTLKAKFPNMPEYRNPMGFMQGGIIITLMDNTMGPLSFMVAQPSVTTQLNTSYLRPVTPQDEFVYVTASVDEMTRRQLFMSARATNAEGKTFAICYATCAIMGE
ncbi:MAG: PaaI family thioesterase [Aggregatilineales bacterium]